jgi:epoxyqueuosine reductase
MLSLALIQEKALTLGFDLVGCAPLEPAVDGGRFVRWLEAGYQGEMGYLARADAVDKRLNPRSVLPGAKTMVMVGLSYETLAVPMAVLRDPRRGRIARYAWGLDYHDVMTPVLRAFGDWLSRESRAYVDTGPVLERAWAERCGLGFIGKNTCLIHRKRGSFLFLGAVVVGEAIDDCKLTMDDLAQSMDQLPLPTTNRQSSIVNRQSKMVNGQLAMDNGCGSCTRCLSACPTSAFPAPGVLDARRCISYLTIEQKGSIPEDLRPHMGNWVFGCDVCQDVCPYVRRFSRPSASPLAAAFRPVGADAAAPLLSELLQLDAVRFRARFGRTPLARAKRRGLLRNACVAAGNSGDAALLTLLRTLENDEEPLVREHASWAVGKITPTA